MRRAWMIGGALLVAVALSATLFATASGKKPPQNGNEPRGVPASIELTPDPIAIQCDGVDATTVTVRVTDARGKPVPNGTEVFFDAVYGFVDPVVAETNRGEASTQARFYEYADNFPGLTGVDVTVGPLRASIGIDCLPPAPPCGPDASPPCPLPCSDTNSPPVGPSPPCQTPTSVPCEPAFSPPCNFTPTPTRTPSEPSCFPQSPPCEPCADWTSPPCDPTPEPCTPQSSPPCGGTPLPTPTPFGTGTIRFASLEPVQAVVNQFFEVKLETASSSVPYEGFEWLLSTPLFVGVLDTKVPASHPYDFCSDPGNVGENTPAYYGGCLNVGPRVTTIYLGELTSIRLFCTAPGTGTLKLVDETAFGTSLLGPGGIAFGEPDTSTIAVTCIAPPTATQTPTPASGLLP